MNFMEEHELVHTQFKHEVIPNFNFSCYLSIKDVQTGLDERALEMYFYWPEYNKMYEKAEKIKVTRRPERHWIIKSPNKKSCLQYISFNLIKKTLHVRAHFRSWNSRMEYYDINYLKLVIFEFLRTNYLEFDIIELYCSADVYFKEIQ